MALGLPEYIASLDERSDLIWPQPAPPEPLKVTPFLEPLPGIRLVTWSLYGVLLHIDQGTLLHVHPQELRMQVALEKTINEFNMWNNMTRKPGQPWEYLQRQYLTVVEELGMVSTRRKGDAPELDSSKIWHKLLDRLVRNDYHWDEGLYGDLDDLSAKVAYFFHASLQGTVAADHARETLLQLTGAGIRNGLLADAQVFSVPQLMRDLERQGPIPSLNSVLSPAEFILSSRIGLRKPSETLYRQAVDLFRQRGIAPEQVLHVSHRLQDDLAVARKVGFRTALYAADRKSCRVQGQDLRNPEWKPDRLISDIRQVLEILTV